LQQEVLLTNHQPLTTDRFLLLAALSASLALSSCAPPEPILIIQDPPPEAVPARQDAAGPDGKPFDLQIPWIIPGDGLPGQNVMTLHLVNRGSRPQNVHVVVEASGKEARYIILPRATPATLKMAQRTIHLPYALDENGASQPVKVTVAANDTVVYSRTDDRTPSPKDGALGVRNLGVFHLGADRDLVTGDQAIKVSARGVYLDPSRNFDSRVTWRNGVRLVDARGREVRVEMAKPGASMASEMGFRGEWPIQLPAETSDGEYSLVLTPPGPQGDQIELRWPVTVARAWRKEMEQRLADRPDMPEAWKNKRARVLSWLDGPRWEDKFKADLAAAELERNAAAAPNGPFTGSWDYPLADGGKFTAFVPSTYAGKKGLPLVVVVHAPTEEEKKSGLWGMGDKICAAAERHKAIVVRVPTDRARAEKILDAATEYFKPDPRRPYLVAADQLEQKEFAVKWVDDNDGWLALFIDTVNPSPRKTEAFYSKYPHNDVYTYSIIIDRLDDKGWAEMLEVKE
jgi:hypothetical protein